MGYTPEERRLHNKLNLGDTSVVSREASSSSRKREAKILNRINRRIRTVVNTNVDPNSVVVSDGTIPFVNTITGITPTVDAHLATKKYVDDSISAESGGFTLSADSGSNQAIAAGNTLEVAGGTGIATVAGATDTVTITNSGVTGVTGGTALTADQQTGSVTLSVTAGEIGDTQLAYNTGQHLTSTTDNVTFASMIGTTSVKTPRIISDADITLEPAGADVLPLGSRDIDLGDFNRQFRSLYASELVVETLVAQDILATIGGRIMVAPTTKLIADLANNSTTIDVEHNNITGKYVILKSAPNGSAQTEVIKIGASSPASITGGYRYSSIERNEDDSSGANNWVEGDAVASLGGTVGEGFIDLTSTSTILGHAGPTMGMYQRTGTTNWNDLKPTVAIGQLSSYVDYGGTNRFGIAIGNDITLAITNGFKGLTADNSSGLRMFNTPIELYNSAEKKVSISSDGIIKIGRYIDGTNSGTEAKHLEWTGTALNVTGNITVTGWTDSSDHSGIAAAQTTANAKSATYRSNAIPDTNQTVYKIGDIWLKTDDGDKPYTCNTQYTGTGSGSWASKWTQSYTVIDGGNLSAGSVVAAKIEAGVSVESSVAITGSVDSGVKTTKISMGGNDDGYIRQYSNLNSTAVQTNTWKSELSGGKFKFSRYTGSGWDEFEYAKMMQFIPASSITTNSAVVFANISKKDYPDANYEVMLIPQNFKTYEEGWDGYDQYHNFRVTDKVATGFNVKYFTSKNDFGGTVRHSSGFHDQQSSQPYYQSESNSPHEVSSATHTVPGHMPSTSHNENSVDGMTSVKKCRITWSYYVTNNGTSGNVGDDTVISARLILGSRSSGNSKIFAADSNTYNYSTTRAETVSQGANSENAWSPANQGAYLTSGSLTNGISNPLVELRIASITQDSAGAPTVTAVRLDTVEWIENDVTDTTFHNKTGIVGAVCIR